MTEDPAELQYAIALYFGRGNATPPDPPEEPDSWEPKYPTAWTWASNPETRRPIRPEKDQP